MSAYQFVVEYQPGKKHGNADAMSRRQCDPSECKCPVLDGNEEILKCGPCGKCKRRANTMDSSIMDEEGKARVQTVTPILSDRREPKSTQTQGTQTELLPGETNSDVLPKVCRKKHGQ